MRYTLAPRITKDLDEIADWIAQDNPARAIAMIQAFRSVFQKIAEHPMHYQLRPDIGEDARLAVIDRYVALFWIDGETVRIERVIHGSRDLPALYA